MNKQKIVALLPMKENSERVKGKNFREFYGKPLFRWILDTLLSVNDIDCVVINTDARGILAKNGLVETDKIIIRDRKPEICGDMVSMNLVIEDDVRNVDADIYLMTHATSPLIEANTVQRALKEFQDGLLSICHHHQFLLSIFLLHGSMLHLLLLQVLRTNDSQDFQGIFYALQEYCKN